MSWKGYTLYSSGGDAKDKKYYQLLTFQQPYEAIEYTYTPAQPAQNAIPGSMFRREKPAKPAVEESVTQKEVRFQDSRNPLPRSFTTTYKDAIPTALKEYLKRDDINWKISFLDLTPFDELHKTSPDGNCLFASIADQAFLLSEQNPSSELSLYTPYCRKLAMIDILLNDTISVNTLIPNSSNAPSVTPNSSNTIPAIKDAYINRHKEDTIEGGEPEIAALSDILQCPIYVWELNKEQTGIKELYDKSGRYGIDFISDKQVINIVRYKLTGTGYHYDALHTRHMPCKPFSYSIDRLPYYSETIENATTASVDGKDPMQRFTDAKAFFRANIRVKDEPEAPFSSSSSSNAAVVVPSAPPSSNAAGVFPSAPFPSSPSALFIMPQRNAPPTASINVNSTNYRTLASNAAQIISDILSKKSFLSSKEPSIATLFKGLQSRFYLQLETVLKETKVHNEKTLTARVQSPEFIKYIKETLSTLERDLQSVRANANAPTKRAKLETAAINAMIKAISNANNISRVPLSRSPNYFKNTRKRSNSITKLAEKPLGFLKTTRFGFNTPDRARYRKLIPAVKLELENLFEDNYNEVDRALNTQCMTDFFIHYIQELEKAGIAPGEPAAIAYYLTNGCNKSLLEVIDKTISLLLKELKDLITATKAPRPVNIPASVNSKYNIANKLIARLTIFLDIYKKQTIDDGINKLLSLFLKELATIRDSDKLPSLRIPMTNLITALGDIKGVNPSLPLKNATNRGKNNPICDIEAEIAPMVNAKYNQVWDHWLNRYIRYTDPKDDDKTHKPLTLSRMALSDKINILFFKIYLEYERLVQLVKTVSGNNSLLGECIRASPNDILLQIERAQSIRKGKYEDLEHFIKQIFLKIYRQIFMIEYIRYGSPTISPDQVDTILSSIRVPPIAGVSNRFYVPRTGAGKKNSDSDYSFPKLVAILHALENEPEIHPTEFELLSDKEFKELLERIPSFSVSDLSNLIQSIESKTNYNTKSRGYIRIQTALTKAKETAARYPTTPFITPVMNEPLVSTLNKPGSAVPQPPPNKPRSASIGGFRYSTQKKRNKKHRRTRRSKLRI